MKKWIALAVCVVLLLVAFVMLRTTPPAFCKVRFGSSVATEVLFARNNKALLIYRDGDAQSEPEVYPMENFSLKDGTEIPPFQIGDRIFKITECSDHIYEGRHSLTIYVTVEDREAKYQQYCDVEVGREPLQITHFDGPLSVVPMARAWVPLEWQFVIGGEPTDLRINVGTFDKSSGCWTVVESGGNDVYSFPEGVCPVATVEFPSSDPDKPIVESFSLQEFC